MKQLIPGLDAAVERLGFPSEELASARSNRLPRS